MELSREEFLKSARACMGLTSEGCERMLDAINGLIAEEFGKIDRIDIEGIGNWRRSRAGYNLFLSPYLAITRVSKEV